MRSKFENKTNMIDVIIALCLKYPAIIALIPALEACVTSLQSIRAAIQTVNETYIKIITGIAQDKLKSKVKTARIMLKFAKAMKAYAQKTGKLELKKQVTFSRSFLLRMRDINFHDLAVLINSLATDLTTELVPYGIVSADFTALVAAYTDYGSRIPTPKAARDAKKTSIIQIMALLKQATLLLTEEMDPLVYDVLPEEHETFKLEWKAGRIIVDKRGPKKKKVVVVPGVGILLGTVTNAVDGSPIEDAEISIVELTISTTSDEEGNFYFENVAAGVYTVKVTAETYLAVTRANVAVNGDAETNLEIGMTPDDSTE
jgi:hypothetical protein